MPKRTITVEASNQKLLDSLLAFFDSAQCADAAHHFLEYLDHHAEEGFLSPGLDDEEAQWEWNLDPLV